MHPGISGCDLVFYQKPSIVYAIPLLSVSRIDFGQQLVKDEKARRRTTAEGSSCVLGV